MTGEPTVGQQADAAVRLAKTEPERALIAAERLLTNPDGNVRATARWAMGRALYELARNDEAIAELTMAATVASSPELISRIVISLSAARTAAGDRAGAAELLTAIMTNEDPVIAALARSQNALLLLGRGELTQAAQELRQSIGPLERSADDGDAAARAVGNLAYCEMTLGQLDEAEAHYRLAVELGTRFDEGLVVAGCWQNLGYLAMRRGHLGEAIAQLTRAESAYRSIKAPARNLSTLYDDMAETHRIAGLAGPSVRYAAAALAAVESGGNEEKIAEARYRLAACALDAGDHDTARAESQRAAAAFRRANRPIWVHRAWAISLETIEVGTSPDAEMVELARRAARELENAGWLTDATSIRNRVAVSLLEADDRITADEFLKGASDNPDQSILSQLETLFGQALAATAGGRSAADEIKAANTLIVGHSQRLADPELRAGAARLSERFRRMDLREITTAGQPADLLITEERWRALSFDLPRVSPSQNKALADRSQQLRFAAAELNQADHWDPALAAEVERLEQEIQPLSLQSMAVEPAITWSETGDFGLDQLRAALGERSFVEWVQMDGRLTGVMVTPDRVHSWPCGPVDPLRRVGREAINALGRLLRPGLDDRGRRRWWDALSSDCGAMADAMLGPAIDTSRPVVLSPPSWLADLPWSLVIGAPDQSICIAPSASTWVRRRTGPLAPTVGIAVGPDLEFGPRDGELVTGLFDTAVVLTGPDATAEEVRSLFGRCDIMHIAAHGTFRSDSPRFSTLRLSDGPLALYELDGEADIAPLMILAACDAGRTAPRSGGELLGFGPTLLTAGATNVIAPTVPVADRAISEFLGLFYTKLRSRRPADALAEARASYADGSIGDRAIASAVLCFGGDCGHVSNTTLVHSDRP